MDKPQKHYAEWKQLDRKDQILYDSSQQMSWRQSTSEVARRQEEGEIWGVIANRYGVSFWGDVNVLE